MIVEQLEEGKEELIKFWDQFMRKGKPKVGVAQSLRAFALSSWLNIFVVCIPIAWVSHFKHWNPSATFTLSFFGIVSLEHLFDYGGEQMAFYLGKDLGDLATITLGNAVEATLALVLLQHCELVLLKSTIIGVVILHLLLVPGASFVTGGARIIQQDLHPHLTQLNHSLLTIGVLSLLLPAAYFSAINTTFTAIGVITEETKSTLLQMSHGLAVLLLIVYFCSRIYLHDPPGEDDDLASAPLAPQALKDKVARLREEDPEVNQFVCIAVLAVSIGLMAGTAEWLVESIDFVRESSKITEEWFGLILIPLVSFAADGAVGVVYFIRHMLRHFFQEPIPPTTLAKAEAIDLSIQFTLFWMPFFVLVGWWTNKPLTLLFDLFEVAALIGACFIVNYVTADAKTNWAEGMSMVVFYAMISLCAWFYHGQPEIQFLSTCNTVLAALEEAASGVGGE
ncbi:hypothetical protein BDN70DRAFT_802382 [Pholiota conissans]|uniref:Sodium/calcium exchanger membrane region domain-containing protein n=1 Tax=Pholiota conissans TaxID=109636 RepID=A0A9P6D3D3_9AGAR|nr:hypothetical protein BDN70DRAFT_802382 [Pholiota conissans]